MSPGNISIFDRCIIGAHIPLRVLPAPLSLPLRPRTRHMQSFVPSRHGSAGSSLGLSVNASVHS